MSWISDRECLPQARSNRKPGVYLYWRSDPLSFFLSRIPLIPAFEILAWNKYWGVLSLFFLFFLLSCGLLMVYTG